ncbi:MAG TPA: NAD-dependent epimerase/dehydratase family protein [Actinomycetes bacterium]
MNGDRVLVTGGTGFVGGLVLARLVAEGRPVRALVRRPADREQLPDPRVELALGDLRDEESLARAADGCAVVYHLAGINQLCLHDPTPRYAVNVEGTRHVLQAARRAGVRRVVHTSSAATLGGDGTRMVDESAPPPAEFTSHYARSKFQAEQLALAFDGVEVVSVNPSSVQGPGRTTGTAKVFIGYLNGRLRFDLPARFGLCYTDDCVSGHLLAEAKGRPGQRYVLNTATLTNSDAIDLIAVIAGLADRPRTLPLPVAMAAASVAEAFARLRDRPPRLCREFVRTAGHPHLYDGSRAERELGLRYTNLRAAMEATVHWYVQQGLVTRPLPRFTGQWPEGVDQPAARATLFDREADEREQEPRP